MGKLLEEEIKELFLSYLAIDFQLLQYVMLLLKIYL